MKVFEPHGDAWIEVQGRILVVKPQGHLNDEEVRRILQRIGEVIPAFGGKPWAVLYGIRDQTLLTPDAEDSATLASPQLTAAGLSALAIVHPAEFSGHLQETQIRSIYADTQCPIRLFNNDADAVTWVNSVIGE